MIRDGILTVTILALIYILDNSPRPVREYISPDYCVIDYLAGRKHPLTGELQTAWVTGYGVCSLQDRYREI